MPLLIVMVLVALGSQVIAGLYALMMPFADDLRNIQNYNIAYYGAIASVERSYLVLRGHTAGFEGSGGWMGANNYGNSSDYNSSIIKEQYFGLLSKRSNNNGILWDIKNLNAGGVIPKAGEGDLDPDISSGNDYIQLNFDKSIQIALYKDISPSSKYYTGVELSNIKNLRFASALSASLRVPLQLADLYDNGQKDGTTPASFLDKNNNIDLDGDGINNDIIVNRTLFGYTGDTEFTIFPSINIDFTNNTVESNDTAIREDVINGYYTNNTNISYETSSIKDTNPNAVGNHTDNVDDFNQSPEDTVNTGFNLLLNTKVSDTAANANNTNPINRMHLKFSLVNLLKYTENQVYPYLEVKIFDANTTTPNDLPDTYFHIVGEAKAESYNVKIKLKKRVFNTNAASDFTVLF